MYYLTTSWQKDDYVAFGPQVEISGTVHGDVYAAGGEVLVDADLIVADRSRNLLTVQAPVRK